MTFADLAAGDAVFVDANTLTYHFEPHARWGAAAGRASPQVQPAGDAQTLRRTPGQLNTHRKSHQAAQKL
ncbi:MAG TPA: hypothetical protein VMG10_15020 [Gemmataceae bacterium]|nr:hypothetical protein [Gemmataceae bacterium]